MKAAMTVAVLLLGPSSITSQGVAQADAKSLLDKELSAAIAERRTALINGDTEKVASLTAEEYLQTDINGRVQSKSTWLAEYFRPLAALIKAGQFRWDVYDDKDVQFRDFGDTVVIVGSLSLKSTGAASPKRASPRVLRFTRVWLKIKGKWLLAACHNALPSEPSKK